MGPNGGSVAMDSVSSDFLQLDFVLRGLIRLEYCTIRKAKSWMKGCSGGYCAKSG
jgi:hypothetical protein